jgi:hypothetical protein
MANQPPKSTTLQWLAAAFAVCHITADAERLAHLEPLASSLLADGEAMIGTVEHAVEPMPVVHLAEPEPQDA